jgi:hypothetical protein
MRVSRLWATLLYGVLGLHNYSIRQGKGTLYILSIAFLSKLKTGKPYIWGKAVNMSYLTERASGLHISGVPSKSPSESTCEDQSLPTLQQLRVLVHIHRGFLRSTPMPCRQQNAAVSTVMVDVLKSTHCVRNPEKDERESTCPKSHATIRVLSAKV